MEVLENTKLCLDFVAHLDDQAKYKLNETIRKIENAINLKVINYSEFNIEITRDCSNYLFNKNSAFVYVTRDELDSYSKEDHVAILKQMKNKLQSILNDGFYLKVASNIIGTVGACIK